MKAVLSLCPSCYSLLPAEGPGLNWSQFVTSFQRTRELVMHEVLGRRMAEMDRRCVMPGDFSTNGARHLSLGQRRRSGVTRPQALKGRHSRCLAPSGLGMCLAIEPRASPWTGVFCPFGAGEPRAECAHLANLEGMAHGR